ncbi:hypothetical protein [Aquimarina sp. MMG016]|uniref:flavodoxin family protein n=1 Tax=Aquimarina sp. MMG016 TaxID=2822690 RepID=UPI001B3A28E6|nr:hypothetical protein [Aquimarina sp. MMG016]MBQ4819690.1 hypothetical protein [Aquimarina sp. MMG016]
MKTCIIYFTFSGNNEMLAKDLVEDIGADLFQILEPKKRGMFRIMLDMLFNRFPKINDLTIDLEGYAHIFLIAPIWNYQIAHPMKTFIRNNKQHLKNYSFITLCSGRDTQKEKIADQLEKLVNHKPKVIIELETRMIITPEQESKGAYKVTSEDLRKFKQEEGYQMLLNHYLTEEELS